MTHVGRLFFTLLLLLLLILLLLLSSSLSSLVGSFKPLLDILVPIASGLPTLFRIYIGTFVSINGINVLGWNIPVP